MSKNKSLIELGEIYSSTMGTDESWAILYFDSDTGELAVIESSDTTGMYPRYSPSGPDPDDRMTLREFIEKNPTYRDKAIRLVMAKLGK